MKKTVLILSIAVTSLGLQAHAEGNPEAGRAKSNSCVACHGADGNSLVAMFPKLAGQEQDYLYHSLRAYKSGKRKNPIMGGQVANLSDADMADLAAYFAAQHGLSVRY